MSPVTRVPGGIPAGGQFAPTTHAEPEISLGASFTESVIRSIINRHQDDEGVPVIDLTDDQLEAVRDHIGRTGDFSYAGVRKAAEDAYFADNGYSPPEYSDYIATRGDISAYFGDPNAVRRDIEQARKDGLGRLYRTS